MAPAPVAAVGPADFGRTDSARFAPATAPFVVAAAPVLAEPDGRASVVVDSRPPLADAAAGQTPAAPVVAMQAAPLVGRAEAVREAVVSATGQGVEPAAQPDAERVTEGRLEIDGASMGRWLTQHLAREAGRAPAGMTAVDRRMSVPWAGALQG